MPHRNFTGFPHPWSQDGNSAGTGAGQQKMPRGTPVSITNQISRESTTCTANSTHHNIVTYRAERRAGTETGLWLQLMCCTYVARRVQNLQKGVRPQLSEADERS